jgi:hypothetical protein
MTTLKPAGKDRNDKANLMLRRMGMSLSVCGALICSAGLVAGRRIPEEAPFSRSVIILASGIIMLIAGIHLWRSTKATG